MTSREQLPNRRRHHVITFDFQGAQYTAGFSFFESGGLAEIFLQSGKPNSGADIAAHDAAILCSICLQHHVPLQTIRHALLRAQDGAAAGPLAHAIDLIDAGSIG